MRIYLLTLLFFVGLVSNAQAIDELKSRIKKVGDNEKAVAKILNEYRNKSDLCNISGGAYFIDAFGLKCWGGDITVFKNDVPDGELQIWAFRYFSKNSKVLFMEFRRMREGANFMHQQGEIIVFDSSSSKEIFPGFDAIDLKGLNHYEFADKHFRGDRFLGICWGLGRHREPDIHFEMEYVFKMVLSNNQKAIKQLAEAKDGVWKAYGLTGILLLKRAGYELDNELKILGDRLRASKYKLIFAPGGCMVYSDTPISEIFESEKWFVQDAYIAFEHYKPYYTKAPSHFYSIPEVD